MNKVHPLILFCLFALSQSTETSYTTGLPYLTSDLGIHPSTAQLSSSIYFYGFAIGIFVLGIVSDVVGRRPVVLFGLTLFVLANILIFFTDNIYLIICFRFLQAFGASVGSVAAQAMSRDSYRGAELSKLYALLGTGLAIMPAISSFIAGIIIKYYGWRFIFLYLFFVVGTVLAICVAKLKETFLNSQKDINIKYKSVFCAILTDKKVLCFGGIIGAFNGIMYSFYIEAPFIFMQKLKIDPSLYGSIILSLGFSSALGGALSNFLQSKGFKSSTLIISGIILSIFSCSCFFISAIFWKTKILVGMGAATALISCMMVQSFSYTIVMPLILRHALEDYGKVNGTAGSLFGAYYYLFVATANFITTRLHDDNIIKTSGFFLGLSILSSILYTYILKYKDLSDKPFRSH
ncbi:MAG: multidrug effflux MFS transporter [Rickettsiaceae bacterium]|nr:multidrug effflux MFS transporter [Rickettsiaceae bacterium]